MHCISFLFLNVFSWEQSAFINCFFSRPLWGRIPWSQCFCDHLNAFSTEEEGAIAQAWLQVPLRKAKLPTQISALWKSWLKCYTSPTTHGSWSHNIPLFTAPLCVVFLFFFMRLPHHCRLCAGAMLSTFCLVAQAKEKPSAYSGRLKNASLCYQCRTPQQHGTTAVWERASTGRSREEP